MVTTAIAGEYSVQYSQDVNDAMTGGSGKINAKTHETDRSYSVTVSVVDAVGPVYAAVSNVEGEAVSSLLNGANQPPACPNLMPGRSETFLRARNQACAEPALAALRAPAGATDPAMELRQRVLINDPDLRLRMPDGVVLRPHVQRGPVYRFAIPAGVTGVTILSNTARPADVIGPFVEDDCELGVLIDNLALVEQGVERSLNDAFMADLTGWGVVEDATCRWTLGHAVLPFGSATVEAGAELVLTVRAAGPYVLYEASAARRMA